MDIFELLKDIKNIKASIDELKELGNSLSEINDLSNKVTKLENKIKNISVKTTDIKIIDKDNLFEGVDDKSIENIVKVLFTKSNNSKKYWVDVIGEPLSMDDEFSTLAEKTEDMKEQLVDILDKYNVEADSSESLDELISKTNTIFGLSPNEGIINSQDIILSRFASLPLNTIPELEEGICVFKGTAYLENGAEYEFITAMIDVYGFKRIVYNHYANEYSSIPIAEAFNNSLPLIYLPNVIDHISDVEFIVYNFKK